MWTYTPAQHKTKYRGRPREILIGPRGQRIIEPYLLRDVKAYLFTPLEAQRQRWGKCKTHRHQSVTDAKTGRVLRDRYDAKHYGARIRKICDRLGVPRWSPNRLRHNVATAMRRECGIDTARILLGHADLNTTEIYAEATVSRRWRRL